MAKLLTEEQANFIRKNVDGRGNIEITKMLNETFNSNFASKQIQNWRVKNRVMSKTPIPSWKKGKKVGPNKKRSRLFLPEGTERVGKRDRILTKRADGRWVQKHRYIWEKAFGKLEKNQVVIFLNGDDHDFRLENLACITRRELAYINKQKFLIYNQETKEVAILLAKIGLKRSEILEGGKTESGTKKEQ